MVTVTWRSPRRPWAVALAGALLLLTAPGALADSTATSQVDALWNQPQGTRVDSAFYIVQSWWDGLTRVAERDPHKRGLQELAQANEDLLNAYTLLQEQRTDPGPHPVAVIDPFLSGSYAFVTGVHVKAPIGAVLGWLNDAALHVEGRGSTDTIIKNLLLDYEAQQSRAVHDLGSATDAAGIIAANTPRQTAMITRILDLALPTSGLIAILRPTPAPTAAAPARSAHPIVGAAAARPTTPPVKSSPSPARGDDSHGGGTTGQGKGDAHPKPGGHQPARS